MKEELGDGSVGVGMSGVEQEDEDVGDEEEEGDVELVVAVLPRMSSM